MATLATQTGIFMIPWITLLQVVIIGAENLDPVYFSFSANNPKTTSLIPLPKHFDKLGDVENDCCTLALFFEVKDLDMQGSGNDAPEMEGAQAQTGTGQATFKFEHTHIRDTDKIFTMDVAMDKTVVKQRHILNFDNCSTIDYKTFNIFATTSITDEKDVKVILVNGKDKDIPCQVKFKPIVPETNPFSEANSKSEGAPPVAAAIDLLTIVLAIVAAFASFVSIVSIVTLLRVIKRSNSPKNNIRMNEKCVPGGNDSDNEDENIVIKSRAKGRSLKSKSSEGDDSGDEERGEVKGGGDNNVTTTCLEPKTFKKILFGTAIFFCLVAIISIVSIVTK